MSVDVDAVNERLNGLVTLLKAVGVDGMSPDKGGTASKKGGLPDARQLDDQQIEAIIKKLQMAQTEAPQIIAALEAQAASKKRMQQQQQHRKPQEPPEQKQQHVEEEEEDDDDEDSFDEDANYPMVGPGCSDDCSVVSDLTTPTVLAGVSVPDEEHYRDTLPPMIVGGGGRDHAPPMMIAPTKRKNLVGAVKPNGVVPPPRRGATIKSSAAGGAAAQRRKHYNATMEKLAHEGNVLQSPRGSSKTPRPVEHHKSSSSSRGEKPHKSSSATPTSSKVKKHSKSGRRASAIGAGGVTDWDNAGKAESTWNAFENTAASQLAHHQSKPKPAASTMIDDDGFLMTPQVDASFDPFGFDSANNAFAAAGGQRHQQEKHHREKPRKKKEGGSSSRSSNGSTGGNSGSGKPSSSSSSGNKPRRSRRASCM